MPINNRTEGGNYLETDKVKRKKLHKIKKIYIFVLLWIYWIN